MSITIKYSSSYQSCFCLMCDFHTLNKSVLHIHYTTHLQKSSGELQIQPQLKVEPKRNEYIVIQKFLDCDDYTINEILDNIVSIYLCNMVNNLQHSRLPILKSIYDEVMKDSQLIWDDDKEWWDLNANLRYKPEFKIYLSECLNENNFESLDDEPEYLGLLEILKISSIIEKKYDLMVNLGYISD